MRKRDLDLEFMDSTARNYAYDFDAQSRKMLLNRFRPHLQKPGRGLEMGSFDGTMTALLQSEVASLEVIEGSKILAERVRRRFGPSVNVHHGWFEEFEPEEGFDHIFLVHGLEHVDDPVKVLLRAKSWLNDQGKLFVAVPNANALSRQIAVKMGIVESLEAVTPGEAQHGHKRTYNLDTLLRDFSAARLEVVESGGVIVKALSNAQFDTAMSQQILTDEYLKGCDELAKIWPDFSASVYAVAEAQPRLR